MGKIKFKRGPSNELPLLDVGEPAFTTDDDRVYIGGTRGNVKLPKQSEVDSLSKSYNEQAEEISTARGGLPSLNDRLDQLMNDLIQRAINVKTPPYNVKGDGTVDTAAIQSAFNVANTKGQAVLYFPDGDYVIDYYIRLYKNTTVILSKNAKIRRSDDTTYLKMFINGIRGRADYATGYNGDGNIHFIGGTIDANSFVNPTSSGVSFFDLGHGENITFKDVTFQNGENSHYFQISGDRNVIIDHCTFLNDKFSSTSGNPDFEAVQIEVLASGSFPSLGAWDNTPSVNVTIQHCVFDGVVRAIGTHGYVADSTDSNKVAVYSENIKILNNTFRNIKDHVLNLTGYDGVTLEGNKIEGNLNGYGIKVDHSKNIKAALNVVKNTYSSGLYVTNTTDSMFKDNSYIDTCQGNNSGQSYSAIRIDSSGNNTFDEVVKSPTKIHQYPLYISNSTAVNRINWSRMDDGKGTGNSGGVNSASNDLANNQMGQATRVLFDGTTTPLDSTTTLGTLLKDIYSFSSIIVVGNDNSSATNNLVTIEIPRDSYVVGASTDRYRLVTGIDTQVSFYFPSNTSLQIGTMTGTCRIRKVIGKI
jgi:hypothetical protein